MPPGTSSTGDSTDALRRDMVESIESDAHAMPEVHGNNFAPTENHIKILTATMIPRIQSSRRQHSQPKPLENLMEDEEESIGGDSSSSDDDSDASSVYNGLSSSDEEDDDTEVKTQSGIETQAWSELTGTEVQSEVSSQITTENKNDPLRRLLKNDTSLTQIEIDCQLLKDWSMALSLQDLMQEIASHSSIRHLKFNMNGVSVETFPDIFECLTKTESVNSVVIVQAMFDRYSAGSFGGSLARNKNTIQKLTLDSCEFVGSGLAVLFLGIQHVRNMTNLTISNCALGGFASEIVSASLPFLQNLKSLHLRKTHIPLEGIQYLCSNLALSKSILELDLTENTLCIDSMRSIARCIGLKDTNIQTIILRKCDIDGRGVEVLCEGIGEKSHLNSLDISANEIGDTGGAALVALLGKNTNIQTLHISKCRIGTARTKQLDDALRYNKSFLKNMFSSEISLSIMDSVSLVENLTQSFG